MRKKLKECQRQRVMSYQHLREYKEGDKVWYQALNGNAWYGPAAVLCQRGASVWLHSGYGDIKKVAACRVKPYELVDRELDGEKVNEEKTAERDQVMLEDGLTAIAAVDSLEETSEEIEKDTTGAKYLQMETSVCFANSCIFVVELPVSEHGRPEVI